MTYVYLSEAEGAVRDAWKDARWAGRVSCRVRGLGIGVVTPLRLSYFTAVFMVYSFPCF